VINSIVSVDAVVDPRSFCGLRQYIQDSIMQFPCGGEFDVRQTVDKLWVSGRTGQVSQWSSYC
jgi:hypothetical protein